MKYPVGSLSKLLHLVILVCGVYTRDDKNLHCLTSLSGKQKRKKLPEYVLNQSESITMLCNVLKYLQKWEDAHSVWEV